MRFIQLLIVFFLAPIAAFAGDLTVTVRDATGKPAPDAVVMVYPASGSPAGPVRFPWPYVMAQQGIRFDPFVLVVPVGTQVTFPNRDKVRHHVYSFSPGNRFELKLYGREDKRTVRFDTVGVVAIGCNIHDQMIAFIRVVDTPYAIKTDADGVAVLRGLPAGKARLALYHPFLRAPKNETSAEIVVPGQGMLRRDETVSLRPPPKAMSR